MPRYKITLSYDGSPFSGWQIQPGRRSVQGCLNEVCSLIAKEPVYLSGSGRTDAGVHAKGQVAHFSTASPLSPCFQEKANLVLPSEIRILSTKETTPDFHARFSAIEKTYHYHITSSLVLNPFEYPYRTHLFYKMDLDLLKEALKYFIGTHDFSTFANARGAPCSPIKTLHELRFISEGPENFRLEFTGCGFLYKMVRNIVGTLIHIARGKILLETLPDLFAAKDRKKIPAPAPAKGLFLMSVKYKD